MSELVLTVVTPEGSYGPVGCDSIHLNACDDADGRGGGSCGIRPDHIDSLIALEKGPLKAFRDGKIIFQASCGSGFATVSKNTVTVVTEKYSETK